MAYRSVSHMIDQATKSAPEQAVETNPPDDIYNGPVAIRPMVTAPQLMRKIPTTTNASQTPSARR